MDKISKEPVRVVCVGGGHCNCLVMRLLKASLPDNTKLTLVSESPMSYYSGMLPGASSSKRLDSCNSVQDSTRMRTSW